MALQQHAMACVAADYNQRSTMEHLCCALLCTGLVVIRSSSNSNDSVVMMYRSTLLSDTHAIPCCLLGADETAAAPAKVPIIYYLSGLTCTDENVMQKSGVQRACAQHSIAFIAPDTSPRGLNIEGESDAWDFGVGAGFYVNATVDKWKSWRMYDYITKVPVGGSQLTVIHEAGTGTPCWQCPSCDCLPSWCAAGWPRGHAAWSTADGFVLDDAA